MRSVAFECFKIIHDFAPSCLSDLPGLKKWNPILDI